MVRLADCPPCQVGDHKHHYETIQAVPEGMMGGVMCPCKGECKKDAPARRRRFLERSGLSFLASPGGPEDE